MKAMSSRFSQSFTFFGFALITLLSIANLDTEGANVPSYATQHPSIFGGRCPHPMCKCDLDSRGRMDVSCMKGGLSEIPTPKISPSVEVIRIYGPDYNPNHLTIGRFFRQFKRLEELHIVGSNVPNIGENSFWGVKSLRVLNLTRNNISLIVESNFNGLVSVETLSLRNNAIESFVSASFQHLHRLKKLDLSNNRFTKLVERLFYNLHMLESLDLSYNIISELNPDVFRDIWRLKELYSRRCGLRAVNSLLYALLPDIEILDLGENNFKYLNKEEFTTLQRLRYLYLDGNQLSSIQGYTFASVHLAKLTLARNRIVRVDPKAFSNSAIEYLSLSGNNLDFIDVEIFSTVPAFSVNMTGLDLSYNPDLDLIETLKLLKEVPSITQLALAGNGYVKLPNDMFQHGIGSRLEMLNISDNKLTELESQIFLPLKMNLKVLDISKNQLKGLSHEALETWDKMSKLEDIRMTGNPWQCDLCHIAPLRAWIQRAVPLFSQACHKDGNPEYCLRCAKPAYMYYMPLQVLQYDELEWCQESQSSKGILNSTILWDDPRIGLYIGCVLILMSLLISVLIVAIKSKWHAAHYYTHEEERPEVTTPPVPPPSSTASTVVDGETNDAFDNLYYIDAGPNGHMQNGHKNVPNGKKHHVSFIEPSDPSGLDSKGVNGNITHSTEPPCHHRQNNPYNREKQYLELLQSYPELSTVNLTNSTNSINRESEDRLLNGNPNK